MKWYGDMYMNRIIIDGNAIYEVDEECLRKKEKMRKSDGGSRGHMESQKLDKKDELKPGNSE